MGAPESGIEAAGELSAETLLGALRTIKADERAKHENVLNYWLSIRGSKEFPPLHDLDPLEISDAGPNSILLELIGGGQDAEVRHLGEALAADSAVSRIIDAPNPSLLSCIARKLPIVAISRDILAFEDNFTTSAGPTRCWVTMLPLSSCGSWVDYVYAYVSLSESGAKGAATAAPVAEPEVALTEEALVEEPVAEAEQPLELVEPDATEEPAEAVETVDIAEEPVEPVETVAAVDEPEPEPELAPEESAEPPQEKSGPGFSKLLDGLANLTGFYGQSVNIDPLVQLEPIADEPAAPEPVAEELAAEPEPVFEEPAAEPEEAVLAPEPEALDLTEVSAPEEIEPEQPAPAEPAPVMEADLQTKLADVRAKADEAREAQRRATEALHHGLSAAYDFAIDAEGSPEEYLRLVEAQGMKIQLRAPMAPIARLAFDGVCDADTIAEFEAVLAWALRQELPRGALLERIDQAGGIGELLAEVSRPS